MKKLLILILSLGMIFAATSCELFEPIESSTSSEESLSDVSNESSEKDSSNNNSNENSDLENSEEGSSNDSQEDSSVESLPTIDGENELPLVPIG